MHCLSGPHYLSPAEVHTLWIYFIIRIGPFELPVINIHEPGCVQPAFWGSTKHFRNSSQRTPAEDRRGLQATKAAVELNGGDVGRCVHKRGTEMTRIVRRRSSRMSSDGQHIALNQLR
jgi:hypothetical protein